MKNDAFIRLALTGIMAGGIAMTGCNTKSKQAAKEPEQDKETTADIQAAKTLEEFQSECAKMGGTFNAHDCTAKNSCKGYNFEEGKGVSMHDCQGKSSCKGAGCVQS